MMNSPGEYQADSPKCVIRVPTSQLPKPQLHPTQEPKLVDQKDKKSEETNRLSTRATSVMRPRAVLSSPENDEMTGSKNTKRVTQPSPLRNHSMVQVQQRHVEHKIIPSLATAEIPIENDRKAGSKDSKRVIQPSPLRNHNMVQQRHVEHKIIPSQAPAESSTEKDEMTGSKDSKRVIQPSPLRNHNIVKQRHVEQKIIRSQTTVESLIENDERKRVIQPSPLRHHNMVQKRHIEHKKNPPQAANETPASTRRKPPYAVNNHTPSTASIKGKSKTANNQSLTKVKQASGIVASSQKVHLKSHKANSIA